VTNTATSSATESFPDPKRSWKRSGVLLGLWVVVWAAVAIIGTGWNAVAQPGEGNPHDEYARSADEAAERFMHAVFANKDWHEANLMQCANADDLDPHDLRQKIFTRAKEYRQEEHLDTRDVQSFESGDANTTGSSPAVYRVVITVYWSKFDKAPFKYDVKTEPNADRPCVSKVVSVDT
jgi:hypothetical protein